MLLILLSLIPAAGCYATFAWWLPHDGARHLDYRAAEACSAREMEQRTTDCLTTRQYTVVRTVNKPRNITASLTDGNSWRGTVAFGDSRPLLERLMPGDRVTATIWRRHIVVLSKDGVRQNTAAAPRDELQANAALGTIGALFAAQSFIFGAVRLTRPRDYKSFSWSPYGKRLLLAIFATFFGVGLPALMLDIPWQVVPPVSATVAVCAAGVLYFLSRPRAAGDT
ncbi:hypothetical protein [Actinomadura sp. WMMB 499]|uniref:hypothetical protein n=1 Tax=Actinomadura sp. WMMB 499 TaxID=1219491 RepID=UPI001245F4E8|nr:hypothetical protein [Actinomadura sp. WMMB 499]QFG23544.1 hypothetical protein F7P10_22905 [Actinomadura sp. WMMB 499]